jgi:3-polyprenyl-4-hydroxybenzoate decarboxylase
VGRDGAVHAVDGASAGLVRAALELLAQPLTRDELAAAIVELSGAALPEPRVIDDVLALLRDTGAIHRVRAGATVPAPIAAPGARVVLALTGAIGTLAAPALVAALQRRGCDVRVAATRTALRFASVPGLEAITHRRVVRSLWSRDPAVPVPHLELAAWADLIVICPMSATTLARLASGDHGDVVSASALATRVPVVLAPSMNAAMLDAPAVQRNLERVRADGFYIVPPGPGLEVADPPDARAPRVGGAPPPERMADLAVAILPLGGWHRPAPRTIDWEAAHAARAVTATDVAPADPEVVAALAAHGPGTGMLLDIGTGDGAIAEHAAGAGYTVVATEVSATALARARARAGDRPITWLRDDITDSRIESGFRVAIDRGCVHHLAEVEVPRWAHAVTRLVVPGGLLIVKADATDAPATRDTRRLDGASLQRLLAPAFELVEARPSHFLWGDEKVPAVISVLRRVSAS